MYRPQCVREKDDFKQVLYSFEGISENSEWTSVIIINDQKRKLNERVVCESIFCPAVPHKTKWVEYDPMHHIYLVLILCHSFNNFWPLITS